MEGPELQEGQDGMFRQKAGRKIRRRKLHRKKDMEKISASGGVTGRNTVIGDLWPWSSAVRTEREQFSAEKRSGSS